MFELSVALKYLIPRRKQLSVSIISMISVFVIALVVWLILVFFSVTNGLEKVWVGKLTSLTAPARLTPTQAYYQSYYYQIDSMSAASDYSYKSIGEKRETLVADPYDPSIDEEVPQAWPIADTEEDGSLKDLVKKTFSSIERVNGVPGLVAREFEIGFSNIQLHLVRQDQETGLPGAKTRTSNQSLLNHSIYLGSFDPDNATMQHTLLPLTMGDISNLIEATAFTINGRQDEERVVAREFQKNLHRLFDYITIKELKTVPNGWLIPKRLLPEGVKFQVLALLQGDNVLQVIVPEHVTSIDKIKKQREEEGYEVIKGILATESPYPVLISEESKEIIIKAPISIPGNVLFSSQLIQESLNRAERPEDIQFLVSFNLQGTKISGKVPYRGLQIDKAEIKQSGKHDFSPFWVYRIDQSGKKPIYALPQNITWGASVLLPKSFREVGLLVGDRGFLSYYTPTATSMQEQRVPVYVAGFFDPGVVPIGGKFALALPETLAMIRTASDQSDWSHSTSGINIRFDDISQANYVKESLAKELEKEGLSRYWQLETYREYEFTKNLLQQLKSDKNLFSLISVVIIIVACSNIISMLIILVNDKKVEIGILRAMGATSRSIASIFALCGVIMGTVGSVLGISLALFTLHHLQSILDFMGKIQGHDVFNAMYFGTQLPTEISYEALLFVLLATVIISLLAGVVPAIKASLLKPSAILRSE